MSRPSLLGTWPLTRRSASTWRVLVAGDADTDALVRAVARALAHPRSTQDTAGDLLASGDFEAAEYLLADELVLAELDAEALRRLEAELEQARGAHLRAVQSRLFEMQERARRVGYAVDPDSVLAASGAYRSVDEQRLDEIEMELRSREAARVKALRERLQLVSGEELRDPVVEAWRAQVEQAIALGAVAVAEAAVDAGPSADISHAVEVPAPPVWPYRREPLDRVLGWFCGEGAIPAGFERYRPSRDDRAAFAFLDAVRRSANGTGQDVLCALADVLGTSVPRIDEAADGLTGYFSDLSAPALLAFGVERWPDGVPVWLSDDPEAPDPETMSGQILVRLVVARDAQSQDGVLHLGIDDVLAVLHDTRRRERLLAHLGRQLPLELAFKTRLADISVGWARADVPDLLQTDRGPTLLLAAPGMGKSTFLRELQRSTGGALVDAGREEEMPDAAVVLIDGVEGNDEASVRRLVREVHWARTTKTPPPIVIVAARPESRELFERLGGSLFETVALPSRSLGSLREQAATALGWVGIQAEVPSSYDRMALLAGGNPTVLFQLCGALALVLSRTKSTGRRFHAAHLDEAWGSAQFRDGVRSLLWAPIATKDGVADTLRTLLEFASPPTRLSLSDLTWALSETLGPRTEAWVSGRVQILSAYGLIDAGAAGIRLAVGGPGTLIVEWLREE